MPCFRGIELSIVAASDNSIFPEFPHPDGSSVRLGGLQSSRYSSAVFLSPRRLRQTDGHLSDEAQIHADPKISVYIPSAPDTNFYIHYTISQAPLIHKYLFFRVNINGRQVVSWGVDLAERMTGAAHQALFEPSTYYQHNDNGVVMTEYGIESRCFRFVNYGSRETSIANDGGLIEVQVFRAKARNRRAPQPDQYRGGDKYGVALVSNGLLENPHMASYYDYHLIDAKDAPYASFRFHYRSWGNLRLLQLAPADKPDFLCASPSRRPLAKVSNQPKKIGFDFSAGSRTQSCGPPVAYAQFDNEPSVDSLDLPDYPTTPGSSSSFAFARARLTGTNEERPLPELPVSQNLAPDSRNTTHRRETQGARQQDGEDACNEAKECHVQRARGVSAASKSSVASKVSIAKSLQAYADGEDGLLVDTMEFGSAIKLETIFHGKASEKTSPKSSRDKCSIMPGDDIFRSARSSTSEEGYTHTSGYLKPSPIERKPKPKMIYVAPFTDSLLKREAAPVQPSPTRQCFRGVSHDSSPKSWGSPKQRRSHGGSLDARYQTLTERELLTEEERVYGLAGISGEGLSSAGHGDGQKKPTQCAYVGPVLKDAQGGDNV